ncbi:unnamed protein product [Merluccius merluccius]
MPTNCGNANGKRSLTDTAEAALRLARFASGAPESPPPTRSRPMGVGSGEPRNRSLYKSPARRRLVGGIFTFLPSRWCERSSGRTSGRI